jgi:lipoprotein-anchoring transpeptidase ErfK/SrfK
VCPLLSIPRDLHLVISDNGRVISTRLPRRTTSALVGAGVLVAALTGWAITRADQGPATSSRAFPAPAPHLVTGGLVSWEQPLTVRVTDGALVSVLVTDQTGQPVPGRMDGPAWTSTSSLLPGSGYHVYAVAKDLAGRTHDIDGTARTTEASKTLHAKLSPRDNRVVGVGLPAIVTLDRAVTDPADRAAIESRLSVTTDPPVAGAWRWMSPSELHYRGPAYWEKGTKITVTAAFGGLRLSDGVWGAGTRTTRYTIGSAVISTVDVATKRMTVTVDGKVVRVVKVSTGRDKYPTKGGVHLVLEKVKAEVMDSATVGIPRNSPDGYYETVPNSVRISYGGAFVHSASWSVRDQGVRNVSHGCVNISPTDAEWFFNLVRRGDIVNIVNAKAPPLTSDPGMSDWNIPFSAWAN